MSASAPVKRLGDLQLRILKFLWSRPDATVADVHDALESLDLAFTTVATMLRKMENRGLVIHKTEGRRFLYSAAVAEDQVSQNLAGELLDKLFEGSLSEMVNHLLSVREVSKDELARLEKLIEAKKRGR